MLLQRAGRLREMIAPEVERVREELFGASTPPFSSEDDAVKWLGGLRAREGHSIEELVRAHLLFSDWLADSRRHEFSEITGLDAAVTQRAHTIPYVARDGDHVTHTVVRYGSPFVALETVSKHLANDTGFHEAHIVMHILCDSPLHVPSITITNILSGLRRAVRVEFNSPDVTQAQMMELLGRVRDHWGRAGGKRINEKDEEFLALLNEEGGVPDSGRKAFFARVSERCTARKIGNYKNSGWRGPYRRWQRLMDKLGTEED